jgi:hypothetical protein
MSPPRHIAIGLAERRQAFPPMLALVYPHALLNYFEPNSRYGPVIRVAKLGRTGTAITVT